MIYNKLLKSKGEIIMVKAILFSIMSFILFVKMEEKMKQKNKKVLVTVK